MMKNTIHNCESGEVTEIDFTPEEQLEYEQRNTLLAWNALRAERNRRLADSDWTQVADAPADAAAWSTYRQALRDLPANTTDPTSPDWPTPPA